MPLGREGGGFDDCFLIKEETAHAKLPVTDVSLRRAKINHGEEERLNELSHSCMGISGATAI